MTESDGSAFLTSLQLADSFLPVGTYTMSYGLESFIQNDIVTDAADLAELLEDYLRARIGPSDVVALSAVHEGAARGDVTRVIEIDEMYHSMQLAREFRKSSTKSGGQLLDLLDTIDSFDILGEYRQAVDAGEAFGHYPVVLGIATSHWGVSEREACLIHMYSFVTGLLGAAQRLLGLSHTRIQEILQETNMTILEVWNENEDRSVSEMESFTPWIDIMGMEHERAELRLFQS